MFLQFRWTKEGEQMEILVWNWSFWNLNLFKLKFLSIFFSSFTHEFIISLDCQPVFIVKRNIKTDIDDQKKI